MLSRKQSNPICLSVPLCSTDIYSSKMNMMGSNAFILKYELITGLGNLLPKNLSSAALKAFLVAMAGFR